MSYKFIIANVILPITPEKMQIKIKNKNKSIDLINLGEANILKMPGLSTIDFDFVAPAYKYPYVIEYREQVFYYNLLEKLKTEQKPFIFSIIRQKPNGAAMYPTNFTVSLEDYTITESIEEGFDVVFSVSLKQYKEFNTQYVQIQESKTGEKIAEQKTKRETTKTPAKNYTVKKGDSLWNIAKKELGNGTKYKDIAKINNLANPNLIYPGQVLRLP